MNLLVTVEGVRPGGLGVGAVEGTGVGAGVDDSALVTVGALVGLVLAQ